MLEIRYFNNGKEEYIDLSKKCHETMADEHILRMLGKGGVIRELRQECDFFCGEEALTTYMSRDLSEGEAEIYMSDELSGERFFIFFSDKNMAHYLKLNMSDAAGCIEKTSKRLIHYIENYHDDDGVSCDELMYMALVTIYEMNCYIRELSNEEFFEKFERLKAFVVQLKGNTSLGMGNSGLESLAIIGSYIELSRLGD